MKKGETIRELIVEKYDKILDMCYGNEDLCQDVILSILEADTLGTINYAYTFDTIVERHKSNILNKKSKSNDIYDNEILLNIEDCIIQYDFSKIDLKDNIKKMLQTLYHRDLAILYWYFWEGRKLDEIGKMLGVSANSIRNSISSALNMARRRIYNYRMISWWYLY